MPGLCRDSQRLWATVTNSKGVSSPSVIHVFVDSSIVQLFNRDLWQHSCLLTSSDPAINLSIHSSIVNSCELIEESDSFNRSNQFRSTR